MIRIVAAALAFATGAAMVSGCAMQQAAPDTAAYAPYSEEDNPQCGALGNCAPPNTAPHPMRGGYGSY